VRRCGEPHFRGEVYSEVNGFKAPLTSSLSTRGSSVAEAAKKKRNGMQKTFDFLTGGGVSKKKQSDPRDKQESDATFIF